MLIKLSRYVINTDYLAYSDYDAEMETIVAHLVYPNGKTVQLVIYRDDVLRYLSAVSEMSSTK